MMILPALKISAAAYALAAFGACKAPGPPQFDFQFRMLAPHYFRDRTSAQLEQMKGDGGQDGHIGGLTRNQSQSSINITSAETPQVFGDYCLWPTTVQISIELQPTVWVASEYAQGSCRYNVAYVHEMMHVKIARDTFTEFMPGIEALLRAKATAMAAQGPMPEQSLNAAKDAQLAELQSALDGAIKGIGMVLEGRQAVIDTPEAYRQASNACPNEGEWGRR
jgi:hypothetical protein